MLMSKQSNVDVNLQRTFKNNEGTQCEILNGHWVCLKKRLNSSTLKMTYLNQNHVSVCTFRYT